MNPSKSGDVRRFDRAERLTHRIFALLMGVCLVTAALLYIPALGGLVGQRDVVRMVHLVAGFALPVPLLVGYLVSRSFRVDVARLGRFQRTDWEWLRRRDRRTAGLLVGKFNAGQKLNAAFTVGSMLVLLATGSVMTFASWFPDYIRTGSTFTHGWFAIAVAVVAAGHLWMAYGDPEARRGMRTGVVSEAWVHRNHPGEVVDVDQPGR